MTLSADELREEVRSKYAESALAVTEGAKGKLRQRELLGGARRPTPHSAPRSTTPSNVASFPRRPRSPASGAATRPRWPTCARARRCSTSAPGRDRRHPLGEARRPDRPCLRARHDGRDAQPRPAERPGGRRAMPSSCAASSRTCPAGRPVDVVISNCVINLSTEKPAVFAEPRARAQARRTDRDFDVAEDRLTPQERRARLVRRLHRRGPLEGRVRGGFRGGRLRGRFGEFTHEVADGIHGAMVKAARPAGELAEILVAAAATGCC